MRIALLKIAYMQAGSIEENDCTGDTGKIYFSIRYPKSSLRNWRRAKRVQSQWQ